VKRQAKYEELDHSDATDDRRDRVKLDNLSVNGDAASSSALKIIQFYEQTEERVKKKTQTGHSNPVQLSNQVHPITFYHLYASLFS
jgi:hypothetical protein